MMDDMAEAKRIAGEGMKLAQLPRPAMDRVFEKIELASIYLDDGADALAAQCLRQAADICDQIGAVRAALLADPSSTGERGE